MKSTALLVLSPLLAFVLLAAPACAAPPAPDADVRAVVAQIAPARLEITVRRLAAFPTRHTLSGASGADAAAAYLQSEFEALAKNTGGRLQVERQTWTQPAGERMTVPATLSDVVATLPGTDTPERVIVLSGHYDGRVTDVMDAAKYAPGANDDASGVAVVLEAARVLSASPHRFGATLVFAAVTGEEQGLYGSAHLAQTMKAAGRNVVAMITNDIVGNSRGQSGVRDDKHVRVFSAAYDPALAGADLAKARAAGTDTESPARLLARATKDAAARYVKGFGVEIVYRNDRYGRGGDHSSFLLNGYPAAVRLTEPNEDWRHQHQDVRTENGVRYGDLPEFVDFAYLARVARVNTAAVAEWADAPPAPASVRLVGDLSPDTTLRWDAAPAGNHSIAGYEILARRTSAPDWERAIFVPAGRAQAVLPLSKDDYLFAVRAVGGNGARGLPAVPVAARP